MSQRQMAAHLGRTFPSVSSLLGRLNVPPLRKPWSQQERQFVIEQAGKLAVPAIARALNRTESSVHQLRYKLGLNKKRTPTGNAFRQYLCEKHSLGWSDAEIAAGWGLDRHAVMRWRQRLGIDHNAYSDHRRARVREKTNQQLAALGLKNMGELRRKVFADRARAAGWPEDLRPRAVQILTALWERGPMTRRQLADVIGANWCGSRKSLCSNDAEGTYLSHLMKRGLVVDLGRIGTVRGQGKGRSVHVYSLPLTIERKVAS